MIILPIPSRRKRVSHVYCYPVAAALRPRLPFKGDERPFNSAVKRGCTLSFMHLHDDRIFRLILIILFIYSFREIQRVDLSYSMINPRVSLSFRRSIVEINFLPRVTLNAIVVKIIHQRSIPLNVSLRRDDFGEFSSLRSDSRDVLIKMKRNHWNWQNITTV